MEIPSILVHDVSGLRFRWNVAVGVVNVLGKRGGDCCAWLLAVIAKKFITG